MKQTSRLQLLALATVSLLAGCATSPTGSTATSDANGAKLWAQNCTRCHNSRSPTEFSDAQWDVVLLHMRVRAGLAAGDAHAIRDFLRTAN